MIAALVFIVIFAVTAGLALRVRAALRTTGNGGSGSVARPPGAAPQRDSPHWVGRSARVWDASQRSVRQQVYLWVYLIGFLPLGLLLYAFQEPEGCRVRRRVLVCADCGHRRDSESPHDSGCRFHPDHPDCPAELRGCRPPSPRDA